MNMLLSIVFSINTAFASPFVKILGSARTEKLSKIIESPAVAVLFQVDCPSCKMQIQDLKCLESKYKIILLGAFSSEASLAKEYLKMKVSYPAYYVDRDTLRTLNVSERGTPQAVLFIKNKTSIFLGYRKCRELNSMFSKSLTEGGN